MSTTPLWNWFTKKTL